MNYYDIRTSVHSNKNIYKKDTINRQDVEFFSALMDNYNGTTGSSSHASQKVSDFSKKLEKQAARFQMEATKETMATGIKHAKVKNEQTRINSLFQVANGIKT